MENNSILEQVLLVFDRNAELLQKDQEEKFDNSEKFAEKKFAISFCLSLLALSNQISIESVLKIVMFSLNVLMTVWNLKFYQYCNNYKKYFLGDFLSADFLQKL